MTENEQQPPRGLEVDFGKSESGELGLLITLGPSCMVENKAGEPCSGTFLSTWQTRMLAYRLLLLSEEVDSRVRFGLTT